MASKPVLPEELISLILSHLSPKIDNKTIHNIRLCNKMLCRLATPLLYRKINIGMATPSNGRNREESAEERALIDQVIDFPDRMDWVKEMQIHHKSVGISDEEREDLEKTHENDDEDVEVAVANALEDWRRDDARIAFIILKCKNLEVFTGPVAFTCHGALVQRLFTHAADQYVQARQDPSGAIPAPDYLRSVREVEMTIGMSQNSVEHTLILLCLPSLEVLKLGDLADNVYAGERNPPPFDGIIRNTNRVNFVFDMVMFSPMGLDTILQTCPNAGSLTLRWRPGTWNDHFVNTEFCDVLRERGRGLEKLHFDCTSVLEHRRHKPALGSYGSFAALEKMKWLAVPKGFFDHLFEVPEEQRAREAAGLLPQGLRELYVIGVEESEMQDMEGVVGNDVLNSAGAKIHRSVLVPWHHFQDIDPRWRGRVFRNVDYKSVPEGGFEIGTLR